MIDQLPRWVWVAGGALSVATGLATAHVLRPAPRAGKV